MLNGCHVLLVDHQPDSAEFHRFLLEREGARVQVARSCTEAHARIGEVDVLLVDLALPDCEATELLETARAAGRSLPAIAVTNFPRREVRQRAIDQGFLDCLSKPVEPRDLVLALARACMAAGRTEQAEPART